MSYSEERQKKRKRRRGERSLRRRWRASDARALCARAGGARSANARVVKLDRDQERDDEVVEGRGLEGGGRCLQRRWRARSVVDGLGESPTEHCAIELRPLRSSCVRRLDGGDWRLVTAWGGGWEGGGRRLKRRRRARSVVDGLGESPTEHCLCRGRQGKGTAACRARVGDVR